MIEEWRDIKGWEDYYAVSNTGKIKSKKRKVRIFGKLERIQEERIKDTQIGKRGYEVTDLCVGGKRKNAKVHRLVAEAFIFNPSNKPHVNHIDGNKMNNHASNLEWCTARENHRHRLVYLTETKGFRKISKNRWSSYINIDGHQHYLGIFKTKDEAACCFVETYQEWHGIHPFLGVKKHDV